MSVYKRKNRQGYYYDFQYNGRRYFRSTEKLTVRAALEVEREAKFQVRNGIYKKRSHAIPFRLYVPRVMAIVEAQLSDKPRTVQFYEDTYARIERYWPLANAPLRDINDRLITDFVLHLQRESLAAGTINRMLAAIRKLLYIAFREQHIDKPPQIKAIKGERKREFVFTPALKDELLRGMPEGSRPVVRVLFETGMRISEACALKWNDIIRNDEGRLIIHIREGKSAAAKRFIPLNHDAAEILEAQRNVSLSDYVFVRCPGIRVDRKYWHVAPLSRHTISHQFSKRSREMGLPWDGVLHSTRHTALTNVGAAGAGAFEIMQIAGHSAVSMSQRYVHPRLDRLQELMDKAGKKWNGLV
jgi:integrase/recombinase XerD